MALFNIPIKPCS